MTFCALLQTFFGVVVGWAVLEGDWGFPQGENVVLNVVLSAFSWS
jgi:hypothetical protein